MVGERGVSTTEGDRWGLASSTRGLRVGLVGSSLTRITGLRTGWSISGGGCGGREAFSGLHASVEAWPHLCPRLLLGEARGLLGPNSVTSDMMGPELVSTSGE